MSAEFEAFAIMLPRPSDAEIAAVFERGRTPMVRRDWIVAGPAHRAGREPGRDVPAPPIQRKEAGCCHSAVAWDALREQIVTPPAIGHRDAMSKRIKAYVVTQLADPARSVEGIAHVCGISVPGLHRLFGDDPPDPFRAISGSVGLSAARRSSGPEPGASLDNRHLLFFRLQQHLAFQPAVQGSVRSSCRFATVSSSTEGIDHGELVTVFRLDVHPVRHRACKGRADA
jgi:hypothetical protein